MITLFTRIYSRLQLYCQKLCSRNGNSTGGRRQARSWSSSSPHSFPLLFSLSRHTWLPRYPSLQAAAASPEWSTNRDVCGWCSPLPRWWYHVRAKSLGLPLCWPGSQPVCDAPIYWPLWPAWEAALHSFTLRWTLLKKSLVPKGVLVEIMSNQAGTPEILWQVPTFLCYRPLWQFDRNV